MQFGESKIIANCFLINTNFEIIHFLLKQKDFFLQASKFVPLTENKLVLIFYFHSNLWHQKCIPKECLKIIQLIL